MDFTLSSVTHPSDQVTDIELLPIGQRPSDRHAFMKFGAIAASSTRQLAGWADSDGTATLTSDRREQSDQSTSVLVNQTQNGYSSNTQGTFTMTKSASGRNFGLKHKRPKETLKTVLDVVGHVDAAQRANNLRELGIDDATIVQLTADQGVNALEKSSVRRRKERRKRASVSTASITQSNRIGEKLQSPVAIVSQGENGHDEAANENENSNSDESEDRGTNYQIMSMTFVEGSKAKLNSSSKRNAAPIRATHVESSFETRPTEHPLVPVVSMLASGAVTWATVVRKAAPPVSASPVHEQPTVAVSSLTSGQSSELAQSNSNTSMSSTSSSTSILDRDHALDENEVDSTTKEDSVFLVTPNDSSAYTSQEATHFTFGVIELDTQSRGTVVVDASKFEASAWKINDSEKSAILAHFDRAFSNWQATALPNRTQGRFVEWRDGLCFNEAPTAARTKAQVTSLTAETTCLRSIRHSKSSLADRTRT